MKILATADIHLGRRSADTGATIDVDVLRTTHCWHAIVQLAIDKQVDLLLLAGDMVDSDNRFYEARIPLQRGIQRLLEAGVQVAAVAGNHDAQVFPQLVELSAGDGFYLLGAGGEWERRTINSAKGEQLQLLGWSFPASVVREDPLESLSSELLPDPGIPSIGLLHTDLDSRESRYAPTRLADLQSKPLGLWVLGHVHERRALDEPGSPPVLYCGSPQALDPGERGVHGVLLIETEYDTPPRHQWIPFSTVRYEIVELEQQEVANREDFRRLISLELDRRAGELIEDGGERLRLLALRVALTGESLMHEELPELIAEFLDESHGERTLTRDGVMRYVERMTRETHPQLHPEQYAESLSPAGDVARLLIAMRTGVTADEPWIARLLEEVEAGAARASTRREFRPLERWEQDSPPETLRLLEQQAWNLFAALVEQGPQQVGEDG